MRERVTTTRSVVLLVDLSGSMRGERARTAAAAVGASLKQCVSHLTKLYERALRSHPSIIGIAGTAEAASLLPCCDRGIVL